MSDELQRLKGTYAAPAPAVNGQTPYAGQGVTASYQDKLRRLGSRWTRVLETVGPAESYDSASEADMAIVAALVKRNFTDGEIWETLRSSPRYADRVKRKGQRHTDDLYTREMAKARGLVVPFPPDPPPGRSRREPRTPTRPAQRHIGTPRTAPQPVPAPSPTPFTVVTPDDSFITRYIAYASKRTDAPAEAHELMAVGAMSALAGPIVRLPIATSVSGWRVVLWVCYVVDSTVGRKSTVLSLIEDIIQPVLSDAAFMRWEGSPQGFIQRLAERQGRTSVFLRDEYSALLQQMNRGGHMAGMAQMLIRAYDGGTLENIRVKKKDAATGEMERDEDRVTDPFLATLSASTRGSFIERATIDNVLDGFLARFIFVTGTATPRRLPALTPAIRAERNELVEVARRFATSASEMAELAIDAEVFDMAWEIEQAWLAEANNSDHPDALGAAYKRLSESVLKVAALLCIDEGGSPLIESGHYETALKVAARWKQSTRDLIEALGATEFLRRCNEVKASVQRHPGIQLSQLYRHHRKLRKRDFDEILAALSDQEEIEQVEGEHEGAGRPPTLLYPVNRSEAEP